MKYYLVSAENPEIRKTIQVPDEIVPTNTPTKTPDVSPIKAPVKTGIKTTIKTPVKTSVKTPNVSPVKSPVKTRKKPEKSIKAVQNTKSFINGPLLDHYQQAGESSSVSF